MTRRAFFFLLICAMPLAASAAEPPAKPATPASKPGAPATTATEQTAKPAAPATQAAEPPAKPPTPATSAAATATKPDAPATTAEPAAKVHENKVDYLSLPAATEWEKFISAYAGFTEKAPAGFFDLEKKAKTDFTLTIKRPRGFDGFDRFIRRIPVIIAAPGGGDRCGKPVEGIFLAVPHKGGERRVLYSYRYLICAGDPLVSPARFLDKYMEKYGIYDAKDYDRNQHVYYGVQGRYEVRVRPVKAGNLAALEIGVADNAVFIEAYKAWRARLRGAEESVKEKF